MILNYSEIKSHCYNAGFRGIDLEAATKISHCESNWNTNAHNTTGEDSRGLFQINVAAHPQYLSLDLFDAQVNCNVAYKLYNNANKTFKDWTCARKLGLVNPGIKFISIFAFGIGFVLYWLS